MTLIKAGDTIEMTEDGYMFKKGDIYTVSEVSENGKFFYYCGNLALSTNDKRYKIISNEKEIKNKD